MKYLTSAAALLLTACTTPDPQATREVEVSVSERTFHISQLTAGTWTASPGIGGPPGVITPAKRISLITAIEKASGCRVTDSDITRQGTQLDAQVDCGSRLRN